MLSFVAQNSLKRRAKTLARCAATAAPTLFAFLLAGPVLAADARTVAQSVTGDWDEKNEAKTDAEALAREVLSRTENDDALRDWTNRVLEQAMTRARTEVVAAAEGEMPEDVVMPLPAEREAGEVASSLTGNSGTSQVLIFMSLSVPKPSWRQWAAEAARAGVPLVVRGPSPEGLRATIEEVGDRLGGEEAGVAIDPRLFRLFDIDRVPAVVALPLGVPPCRSQGCTDDEPPPFDRITGNIGLTAALAAIAAEGDAGVGTARNHLKKLGVRP